MNRVTLQLRKRAAPWVRQLWRGLRGAVLKKTDIVLPRIPPELLAECRMCPSRWHLVEHLPRGGRVAEIGTDRGVFARHILRINHPDELVLIDLDLSLVASDVMQDKRVRAIAGPSEQIMRRFPDEHFDWVYIDSDHSYVGVSKDITAAAPKVKPGGFLIFNDFAHVDPFLGRYGVQRAVTEFATKSRWPFVWFAYSPAGLYDVALQKPGGPRAAGHEAAVTEGP